MNRREFLKKLGLAAAGALIVPAAASAAEKQPKKKNPPPNAPAAPGRGGKPNLATLFGRVRVVSAGERFKCASSLRAKICAFA